MIYGRLAIRLVVETAQNVAVDLLEIAHDPLCALRGIRFLHEVDRHRRLETGKRSGLLNVLDLIETHKHATEDVVELLVQNMCIEHILLQIRLKLLIEAAEIMRLPFKILIEIRRQFRQLRQRFSEPVDFIGGDIVVCEMAHVFLFLRVRHVSLILPQPTQTRKHLFDRSASFKQGGHPAPDRRQLSRMLLFEDSRIKTFPDVSRITNHHLV